MIREDCAIAKAALMERLFSNHKLAKANFGNFSFIEGDTHPFVHKQVPFLLHFFCPEITREVHPHAC